MNTIKITDLKQGSLIFFITTNGSKGFAKVQSIDPKFNTVLTHNAINIDTFSPIKGRFGGLIINLSRINQIITF